MVTKYDVFLELYEKGGPRKIADIVRGLKQKKSEYDKIRKILENLVEMKFIVKNEYGYENTMNQKNQHLFEMLKYCIKNDVNYNNLFDETIAKYLSKAFLKKSFGVKDIGLHARTFSKISSILEKNGFLIVLSRKPFNALVPYNSFLGNLIVYFNQRPLVAKIKPDEYFDDIKKELTKFKKLRETNNRKYQKILETTQIKFIHHSLSIEGNPITLAQTFKLLKDKIVPENLSMESIHEVENYQKAFLKMIQNVSDELPLSKNSMLNYHFLALQHKPKWAGKIRDDQVIIRGNIDYKVAHYKDIESMLDNLIIKYNEFHQTKKHSLKEIFDFAAYLHNEFQHIHPFFDGNSRTTRLIIFHFLLMSDIPILDIPLGLLEEYVFSTKGAKKRDDKKLSQVIQQIILFNLKMVNEQLS
ncbi:MAG: Fic family protein [Nanoarchaeota archaeon]|nr:Fic family protein [Nanoarchaeota archaeon]MBU1321510.1 Fic family protein [Nanoarchaeota archaeon]MBU1597127.1 Fic family protein [Nanoarchaeota archaeon]MBU2441539.1 Fic family protein [Nanoarchaeota archaeon]